MNEHEAKQKRRAARDRFEAAVEKHADGHLIRKTIQAAVAQGADVIQAFNLGVAMCNSHSGKVALQKADYAIETEGPEHVIVKWGWFAQEESNVPTS